MGSKEQRKNQHIQKLNKKIRAFEKKGKSTDALKKELAFANGSTSRPEFKTGREADIRTKKSF